MTSSKRQSDSGRQNATYTGHEADSPGQPAKLSRTDNASFLEASIDQIISSEKLYGDTFNLYIDILRNNRAFGEKNWGVAKNFYPLSYRPVETSTYSKHILLGNSSWAEYEQLTVPVHLPTENHWLLVLISVFRMYAFTFKILLLQQCTTQFFVPSKKDLSETNFTGFVMRIKLSSRKIIGRSLKP